MESGLKNSLRNSIGTWLLTKKYAVFLELILLFGMALAFIKLVVPIFSGNQFAQQGVVWFANILLIFLVWLGQWFRGGDLRDFGLRESAKGWKAKLKIFLWSMLVLVLGLISFALGSIIMVEIGSPATQADVSGYDYLKDNPGLFILSLIGVYVVSSFGEEIVYRGFLIQRVLNMLGSSKFKKSIAVIISAVVFGLAHYEWGITGIVQTTCMGLVFAGSYILLKKRLVILILAHAYMDTLLFGSIYFN